MPSPLYRAYGAEFAATRSVLHGDSSFYRVSCSVVTHDDMGELAFYVARHTTKEKAI